MGIGLEGRPRVGRRLEGIGQVGIGQEGRLLGACLRVQLGIQGIQAAVDRAREGTAAGTSAAAATKDRLAAMDSWGLL